MFDIMRLTDKERVQLMDKCDASRYITNWELAEGREQSKLTERGSRNGHRRKCDVRKSVE